MLRNCGIIGWASLCLACLGAPARAGAYEELSIAVLTDDGRTLDGAMDARTDGQSLWVRTSEQGIVLATAVAWNDLRSAMLDEKPIAVAKLRSRRLELASAQPRLEFAAEASVAAGAAAPAYTVPSRARQVRNLEIVAAHLVNLDSDVEPDGVEVTIAAIGDDGAPMAVSGNLTASLLGERRPALASLVQFGELDHWSQPVRPQDFVDGVATYQLRFRHAGPEWQFDLLPDAVLTARLGAFGHGNYAASTPVFIRPFNPLRDDRQLLDETRFLPGELHGRSPDNRLKPVNGLWLNWSR